MTLNQLMNKAASAYPDDNVLQYWDQQHECAIDNSGGGDTLAQLIAWELYETFNPDDTAERQISTAVGAMQRVSDSLADVAQALSELSAERLAA